jgi:hypothetical protein
MQDMQTTGLQDVQIVGNSAASNLLTTHRALLQCETTRQDGAILLTMYSVAEQWD